MQDILWRWELDIKDFIFLQHNIFVSVHMEKVKPLLKKIKIESLKLLLPYAYWLFLLITWSNQSWEIKRMPNYVDQVVCSSAACGPSVLEQQPFFRSFTLEKCLFRR